MKDKIDSLNAEGKSNIEYGTELFKQQKDQSYHIPSDKKSSKKKGMFDTTFKRKPKPPQTDEKTNNDA
jgi:hypothetical protein